MIEQECGTRAWAFLPYMGCLKKAVFAPELPVGLTEILLQLHNGPSVQVCFLSFSYSQWIHCILNAVFHKMISPVWPQEGTWRGTGKQFIMLTGPRESPYGTKGSHRPQGKHPRFRLNETVGELVEREREERWGKRGEEEGKGREKRRKQERRG